MKARPSGEKRRKEMLRQERNRDKEEKRKARRDDKGKVLLPGDPDGPQDAAPPGAAGEAGSTPEPGAAPGSVLSGRASVP